MPKGQSRLTVRERQVLANVAVLGDAAHAAATLGLSRRTVERHLAEVRQRWALPTTTQCVARLLREGVFPPTVFRESASEAADGPAIPLLSGPAAIGRGGEVELPGAGAEEVRLEASTGQSALCSLTWAHDGMWLQVVADVPQAPGPDAYFALLLADRQRSRFLRADFGPGTFVAAVPAPGAWAGYHYHQPLGMPVNYPRPAGTVARSWQRDGGIRYALQIALWLLPLAPGCGLSVCAVVGVDGREVTTATLPAHDGPDQPARGMRLAPFDRQGAALAPPTRLLTPRELDVLRLTAEHGPAPAVAARLGVQVSAIEHHLHHARTKLGAATTIGALFQAWQHELL